MTPEPIHAPELTGATAWLNTTAPLSLRALRGKVVLLDEAIAAVIAVFDERGALDRRSIDSLLVERESDDRTLRFNHAIRAVDLETGETSTAL